MKPISVWLLPGQTSAMENSFNFIIIARWTWLVRDTIWERKETEREGRMGETLLRMNAVSGGCTTFAPTHCISHQLIDKWYCGLMGWKWRELVALSLAQCKYEILHLETKTFLNEFLHRFTQFNTFIAPTGLHLTLIGYYTCITL